MLRRRLATLLVVASLALPAAPASAGAGTGPDADSVERLYLAYFLRDPDPGGLAWWEDQRARGVPLAAISSAFGVSEEFRVRYGALGDEAFVRLVYRNVLARDPDAAGLAHWVATLRDGRLDRGGIMLGFSDSAEFKAATGLDGTVDPGALGDLGAGDPAGRAVVPASAELVDTTSPDQVIGTGTPSSCTAAAVVAAVARGGTTVFDCGPDPVTIQMTATAKVRNDADPDVVLDGRGLVTLSGMGERRILYMNTCDPAQVWTTPHCQDQDHPRLTIQRLGFVDGDATGLGDDAASDGGGAVFVRGGRLRIVEAVFAGNRCDPTGPDVAGGALRVLSQHRGLPVAVTRSTFVGNECSNGGALSGIGTSWEIRNSVFRDNHAIGWGANPQAAGTPGGGNGGSLYGDGNTFTFLVDGTTVEDSTANEGGGAIFFVSNDRTGSLAIRRSSFAGNASRRFETAGLPSTFFLGASVEVTDSTSR